MQQRTYQKKIGVSIKKFALFSLILIIHIQFAIAGTSGAWTSSPFDQKVFIENQGQFDREINDTSVKILFGSSADGVNLYFTSKGLMYKHSEFKTLKEAEKVGISGKINEEEIKSNVHFLSMEWEGARSGVEVIGIDPVPFYFTYGVKPGTEGTIKANACKKIIYKNLYPNIDVEYIFPENKTGIKYSIIVHPGGDLTAVKMHYQDAEHISIDVSGNISIKSTFGDFTDHAPVSFYSDGTPVASSFALKNEKVSFDVNNYEKNRILIVDPWTTNPSFPGFNSAYDVNYDLNGNVYVAGSFTPIKLAKFNSAGVLQWIFNATSFGWYNINPSFYGDFAVDENTGTSYMVEGLNNTTGVTVLKVNTLGNQTGYFPGNSRLREGWRAEYNRCINKLIIAGGTISGGTHAAIVDTNMINSTAYNVLSSSLMARDMSMLAVDNNNSFCFMATAKSAIAPTANFDNTLLKCPIPNLNSPVFSVSDGHKIGEMGSVTYVNNTVQYGAGPATGFNGMTVSPNWLYTYDSDSLKRWDKASGSFIAAIDVYPLAPTSGGADGNRIQVPWGGISADECDNIYVGLKSSVKKYNTSLSSVSTFTLTNTVYDVKYGINNKLYACGNGFVTQIDLPSAGTTVTVTPTPPTACNACNGRAVAQLSCGNFSDFKYSWSTSPAQYASVATGLCMGTYTVTINTNCFMTFTGTVTVPPPGIVTTTISGPNSACTGQSTVLTAQGGATYVWNTGANTPAITVSPTTNTIYTVTATASNGCTATASHTINIIPLPVINSSPGVSTCSGSPITLTAGGTAVSYSWQPNALTGNTINVSPASNTTYTVIGTDANGCTNTSTIAITTMQLPVVTINGNSSICNGSSTTLTASGANSYQWSSGTTTTVIIVSPSASSTYTVTGTDVNGCSNIAIYSVGVGTIPVVNCTPNVGACSGNAVTLTAGGTALSYAWQPGTLTGMNISINPTASVNYTVTGTDANGCTNTATTSVTIFPLPVVTISGANVTCSGSTVTLTASGASGYQWNTGANTPVITVSPATTTTYTVTGMDTNGCSNATSKIITVTPLPVIIAGPNTSICYGSNVLLSATGATNYSWSSPSSFLNLSSTTISNPVANPTSTITYIVTGTTNGCSNTDTLTITVNPLPAALFTASDTAGCSPLCVTFTNSTVNGATCYWQFGDATTSSISNPSHCFTAPGSYNVTLTVTDNNGCTSSLAKNNYITVYPVPIANFIANPTTTTLLNPTVHFSDQSTGALGWSWNFGDVNNSSSTRQNTQFTYNDTGSYQVKLLITNQYGCVDDTAQLVYIMQDFALYMPNTFTPNGDEINDRFIPKGIGIDVAHFEMWIYDRWGNLIYKTTDINMGWDGKANEGSDIAQQDTYVWTIELMKTQSYAKYRLVGHVNLLR